VRNSSAVIPMQIIFELIVARNARETLPFVSVYESNSSLLKLTDTLQHKCDAAERELSSLRHQLQDTATETGVGKGGIANAALKTALKNETRLRDKLERLQGEYNVKLKAESQVQADALKMAAELREARDQLAAHETTIGELREQLEKESQNVSHLEARVKDGDARTKLAEQQYDGLKETIRSLQEENDTFHRENRVLEGRLVTEKTKMIEEMTKLTDMVENLKKENNMLKALKQQEDKRETSKTSWFGSVSPSKKGSDMADASLGSSPSSRKFGSMGVVVPSAPKHTITAHSMEGTCLRYDTSGSNLLATGSSDGMIKVWDTSSGSVKATLRGNPGHAITGCDILATVVVGASSDKTCRIWNVGSERLVRS
jgi:autophagy-related protein 16-1